MRFRGLLIVGAALTVNGLGANTIAQPSGARATATEAGRETPTEPVVVELFTAQGCGSCPGANRVVEALAGEPGVIALTYAVDYWDYRGWPDTFARPEFAQRQRAYRAAMRLRNVYTPQVVIDGRRQVSGARAPEVQMAVMEEAARRDFPPQIEFRDSGEAVGVGSGRSPRGGAEVWAVVYRPGPQMVEVEGGDNRGQTVRHMNVVREIAKLGDWRGQPMLFPLPDDVAEGEAVVVMVQARAGRQILSAAGNQASRGRDGGE